MKKTYELWIYGFSALAFGMICFFYSGFSSRLLVFGREIGLAAVLLSLITFLVIWQGNTRVRRRCYYLHSGFLMVIGALGLFRMFAGEINLIWVFSISQYIQILFSIRRGDVIE